VGLAPTGKAPPYHGAHPKRTEAYLKRLDWIEDKVSSTWPPSSFAEERYALQAHIRSVRQEIERHASGVRHADEPDSAVHAQRPAR
jgi:hypothetical protein